MDGTLIRSWTSLKSLSPKNGAESKRTGDDPDNPTVDFRVEKRRNATRRSATDPEARLMRKGKRKEAHLCHSGHVLMENRHGLCMDVRVNRADGYAECRSGRMMIHHLKHRHWIYVDTLGMDNGYDDESLLAELGEIGIRAHVPLPPVRWRPPDPGTLARDQPRQRMRAKAYQISQRIRERAEQLFGWFETIGGLARAPLVRRWKVAQEMLMTGAA